jgi:VanZ family protein
LAAWSLAAFIVFATLGPQSDRPHVGPAQIERFGAYFVTAGAFVFAYPRRPWLIALCVAGAAVLLEMAQLLAPGRDAGVPDAVAKVLGGLDGTLFAYVVVRIWRGAQKRLA